MAGSVEVASSWSPHVAAVAGRPDLWSTALRQARALLPDGWWRRWPPSPLPPAAYRRFRMVTMYGHADADLETADVIGYLEWCKRMRRRRQAAS